MVVEVQGGKGSSLEESDCGQIWDGWVPKSMPMYRMLGMWGQITHMGDESNCLGKAFAKGIGFFVGQGRRARFWLDNWIGLGPFCVLYPRVFRVVTNKDSFVRDCYVWRGHEVVWTLAFRRDLHQSKDAQYKELSSFLTNVFLWREEDSRIWKPSIS